MPAMHLCDITMFYAPESGGVRRYLDAKRQWLAHHTLARHSLLAPGTRLAQDTPGTFTVPAPPLPFSNGYRFPLRRGPWVRKLVELSPDLIEAGDPYRLAGAALTAGERLGVPVIGFYHSDLPRLLAKRLGPRTLPITQAYVRRLYRRFDHVLTPSRTMLEHLQELGVERVSVQPLGVDAVGFHPRHRDPHLRRQLGIGAHTHLLIFAGRYAREKNLEQLVEAFKRLGPHYHLLLVGPDMPFPSNGNVSCFSHFFSAQELARMLASADALVHAGDNETFGLIVLEAMASGIPAVGVDAGAIPELINPAVGALARSSAPAHLAEAVEHLFTQDVAAMGREARRQVEAHWTWDRAFTQLFQTYCRLLGAGSPEQETGRRASA
ncbi:hypothetical protein BJI67_10845 [Acidihalobacter aeolianus]|uniref:Glycoside hydrolase n=2 Tax=Acidihalobacter aeolianus TaxID=2792603 RepID=A0A1D8K978_9GAMM|nr:hypothetical protein BJI67_10845 [Acidihalobacter aeolianus]